MKLSKPSHRITQKDIAKKLGISQGAVSLALKGDPTIPRARSQEILATARSMGYRPSSAGRHLASIRHASSVHVKSNVFGFLNFFPDSKDLYRFHEFAQYFKGAKESAKRLGYQLQEFSTSATHPSRLHSVLQARGIRGLLLPPKPSHLDLEPIDWSQYSFIRFGHSIDFPLGHVVASDQVNNTILAFNKIVEHGYRRIGFVNGYPRHWLFDAGYLKAQSYLPKGQQLPILNTSEFTHKGTKAELKNWILKHRPDAIISCVKELPRLLEEIGFKIPDDFGVACLSIHDGNLDSGIDQRPETLGKIALRSLISLIQDNESGIPIHFQEILIKGTWVNGKSLPPKH